MKIAKGKTVITIDEKEYEIIKTFCNALTEIFENDSFVCMGMDDILINISCGDLIFDNFEIKLK